MTEAWIKEILSGDHEAFRHIVRTHQDRVWNIALSVVKSPDLAQDVVQNSFVNAFLKLSSFSGAVPFEAWLYRIVVNAALQELRKLPPIADESLDELAAELDTVHDESERIRTVLAKMKPNEALSLQLHYLDGFSIQEITLITGWTESNAKVILHRARESMRQMMTSKTDLNS
jgi:RNA polymerase sigma-70 factor (ECF subfamily)